MIIHGTTNANGSVTIAGEPIRLQRDGTFTLKVDLPDRRQVLPVVASSRDGTQQRTTVLAVERNTKVMEPVSSEIEHHVTQAIPLRDRKLAADTCSNISRKSKPLP